MLFKLFNESFKSIDYFNNVVEKEDSYILEIGLPGFNKDHLKISLEDNYLYINAINGEKKEEKVFYLNSNIDSDNIKSSIKDGLLTITLPKKTKKMLINID